VMRRERMSAVDEQGGEGGEEGWACAPRWIRVRLDCSSFHGDHVSWDLATLAAFLGATAVVTMRRRQRRRPWHPIYDPWYECRSHSPIPLCALCNRNDIPPISSMHIVSILSILSFLDH
jgi:hypothetical protein